MTQSLLKVHVQVLRAACSGVSCCCSPKRCFQAFYGATGIQLSISYQQGSWANGWQRVRRIVDLHQFDKILRWL